MLTRFTLRQLDYLVAVGRFGSITGAADHLSVSPPSISNAIAQLEAEFGLPLFVRKHAQGMAPTPSGRALIAQAAEVLAAAKALAGLADLHLVGCHRRARCDHRRQRHAHSQMPHY